MITPSSPRARLLAAEAQKLRPGRYEHKIVKGAYTTSTKEWQAVFGEDYKEAYSYFLEVVDPKYRHFSSNEVTPAKWAHAKDQKGFTRAVKPLPTLQETLDLWLKEDPNILRRYVKRPEPTNGCIKIEYTDLVKAEALLANPYNFVSQEHMTLLKTHIASVDEHGIAYVRMAPTSSNLDGRYYAKGPSQMYLPSYIRDAIISNQSVLDMKNCHPTSTVVLATAVDPTVNLAALKSYVEDREASLKRTMDHYSVDRSAGKNLYQSMNYGMKLLKNASSTGDMTTWIAESGAIVPTDSNGDYIHEHFVKDFSAQSRLAGKLLVQHPAFTKYASISDLPKRISYCLQDVETRFGDIAEAVLHEAGHTVSCRIHDGMIARGRVSKKDVVAVEEACSLFSVETYGVDIGMSFTNKYIGAN
jgi:hypothetical protein